MHRSQIIFFRLNRATVVVIFQSDTCSWFEIDTRDECRNFHFLSLACSLLTAVCFMLLLLGQWACLNLIFFPFTHLLLRTHKHHESCSLLIVIRVLKLSNSLLCFHLRWFFFPSRLPQVKNGSWHSIYEFSYPFPCNQYIIYGSVVFFATKLKATAAAKA